MDIFEHRVTIQDFPDELLLEIFQYMSAEELVTCVQNVCLRWRNISQNSPWLWKNLVYNPEGISEEEMIVQLKEMPQLRTFFFNPECSKLDEIINVLCSHCQYLKTLICDGYGACVLNSHLQKLAESLHELEWFQLSQCQIVDYTSLTFLSQFKNLKKLTGVNVGPHSTFIRDNNEVFQSLEHLEIITYCSCEGGLFDENVIPPWYHFLHLVPHLKSLQHLFIDFRMLHFTGYEAVFYNLRELHNLETLCFKSFFHADRDILTKMFELGTFPKLRKLDLSSCLNITVNTLKAMNKSCPVVQELHFSHCVHFDDECIEALSVFPELLSLDIACCNGVSDNGLVFLARCPKLKVLDLSWWMCVNRETLSIVSTIPCLQKLILNYTRVRHDDIMEFVTKAHNLVCLSLYYCKGDDGASFHHTLPICRVNQNLMDEVICEFSKLLRDI